MGSLVEPRFAPIQDPPEETGSQETSRGSESGVAAERSERAEALRELISERRKARGDSWLIGLGTSWATDTDGVAIDSYPQDSAYPTHNSCSPKSQRDLTKKTVRAIVHALLPDWSELTEVVGGQSNQWDVESEEEEQDDYPWRQGAKSRGAPPPSPLLNMVQESKTAAQKVIDDALKASEEATSAYNEVQVTPTSPDHMEEVGEGSSFGDGLGGGMGSVHEDATARPQVRTGILDAATHLGVCAPQIVC